MGTHVLSDCCLQICDINATWIDSINEKAVYKLVLVNYLICDNYLNRS